MKKALILFFFAIAISSQVSFAQTSKVIKESGDSVLVEETATPTEKPTATKAKKDAAKKKEHTEEHSLICGDCHKPLAEGSHYFCQKSTPYVCSTPFSDCGNAYCNRPGHGHANNTRRVIPAVRVILGF